MLTSTLSNANSSNETSEDIVFLTADRQGERLLHTAEEERRRTTCSTLIGRISLLAQLCQAIVHHRTYQVVDIVAAQIFLVVLLIIWRRITLLIEMTQDDRLFDIFLDVDNHLVVIAYRIVLALSRILRHGNLGEQLLNLLLHLVDINVTHHDDSLQVRTIPLMIIVTQVLIGEVVDDVHRTNRHAVLILRALIDLWHRLFHQSLHSLACTTCTPLFMDDTSFLVNLCIF